MKIRYMETGGEGFTVRPWVWIVLLFLGPAFSEILFELHTFLATRALTHTQALITQLVFEHSLRIRLVAEERSNDEDGEGGSKRPLPDNTPETESVDGESNETASSIAGTSATAAGPTDASSTISAVSSDPSKKGKGRQISFPPASVTQPDPKKVDEPKKDSNLIGKINNLVTTDLSNIIDARNFLYLRRSCSISCFSIMPADHLPCRQFWKFQRRLLCQPSFCIDYLDGGSSGFFTNIVMLPR